MVIEGTVTSQAEMLSAHARQRYLSLALEQIDKLQMPTTSHEDARDWLGNALADTADDSEITYGDRLRQADDLYLADRYDDPEYDHPCKRAHAIRTMKLARNVLTDVMVRS